MNDQRSSSIRLFFALWPDPPARAALLDSRASAVEQARPTRPDDLHMTLVFIGNVEPAGLPCIEAAADDVAVPEFEFRLRRLETWRRQRLLVASPDDPPPDLFELVGQLQRNLLACGIVPERRQYRPHVTLARKAARVEPLPLDIRWPAESFVLVRSGVAGRDSFGGYQVLRTWALR